MTPTAQKSRASLKFSLTSLSNSRSSVSQNSSAKFGNLYAATSIRPSNTVSVTSILGGTSDNTGSGIPRRLVMKTGINIILACNIPKKNPLLEAKAEKMLIAKLIDLGYTLPTPLRAT